MTMPPAPKKKCMRASAGSRTHGLPAGLWPPAVSVGRMHAALRTPACGHVPRPLSARPGCGSVPTGSHHTLVGGKGQHPSTSTAHQWNVIQAILAAM